MPRPPSLVGVEELADGELLVRRRPGVVELVFNRPERHNAFTDATYDALRTICVELAHDEQTRVLVLRGAGGRAFAAGNDISSFTGMVDGAAGVAYEAGIRGLLHTLAELPQVTVAAVEGICVGGGLAVATFCDLRICTEGSRFGYPIARTLGNALSASIVYRCAAVFGESLTREMLLTSRLADAHRAYAVGAVLGVVPPDELDRELEELVAGLLAAAPMTLRATKQQLLARSNRLEASPPDDNERLEKVYGSDGFREGVRAFLAKERPRFR